MTKIKESLKPQKVCPRCGRSFEMRKKWINNWPEVVYCSDRCRNHKLQKDYSVQILELLKKRGIKKTICPSEVLPEEDKQNKNLMEEVRRSARRLADKGVIEIVQNNKVVDPSAFRGPIRLRLKK